VKAEFDDIRGLVEPGARKHLQARAKLRSLAVIEASLNGERSQPGERELEKLLGKVRAGRTWQDLFPGVASLEITTEQSNTIGIAIRLTKREGRPVHLVPEGTPGATIVSVKRVNELDYYSLGLTQLAAKLKLSPSRTLALIRHLGLQERGDSFKLITIGRNSFKRYSKTALDACQDALMTVDMDKVWQLNRPGAKAVRRP